MNKTVLITGPTSGIGKATAVELAREGYTIALLARDLNKALATKEEIIKATGNKNIDIQSIDLASLQSVKKAANELKVKFKQIDLLINNAGGIFNTRQVSADGYELTFAINHLGHFLLTNLLIDNLKAAGAARIINVSSEAHRTGKINFEDIMLENNFTSFKAYSQAKLANILFTNELHLRYSNDNISSFSLHPGVVNTGFGDDFAGGFKLIMKMTRPLMRSPLKGAATSVYLAKTPSLEHFSGNYFKDNKPTKLNGIALDKEIARKLWELSEKLTSSI